MVDIARRSFSSFPTEFEGLEYNLGGHGGGINCFNNIWREKSEKFADSLTKYINLLIQIYRADE